MHADVDRAGDRRQRAGHGHRTFDAGPRRAMRVRTKAEPPPRALSADDGLVAGAAGAGDMEASGAKSKRARQPGHLHGCRRDPRRAVPNRAEAPTVDAPIEASRAHGGSSRRDLDHTRKLDFGGRDRSRRGDR